MKTLREIIDFVWDSLENCNEICEICTKENWCYIDSTLLTIDYLYKGEY